MKKAIVRNAGTGFGIEIVHPDLIEIPGHGSETVKRMAADLFYAAVKTAKRILFEQGAHEVEVLIFGGENEVVKACFLPSLHLESFGENGLLTRAHCRSGSGLASAGWGMVAQPYPEFNMNGFGEADGKVTTIWLVEPWMVIKSSGSVVDIRG
jgi:hypothetical protein